MTANAIHGRPIGVSHAGGDGAAGRGWTAAANITALAASAVGVLTGAAYRADRATESMLRGFDLTTLAVVVPALALILWRGDRLALLRPGLVAYLLYAYVFAAATGGMGAAFLLDVATAGLATVALLATLAQSAPIAVREEGRAGRRLSAAGLLLLALSLGGMWIAASVQAAVNGITPSGSGLVETALTVRLGITLDLWLLVPLYAVAAVLLLRNHRWGVTLGLLAAVSGLAHQLSYLTALAAQARADVPGAPGFDPVEPVIIACYLLILWPLLRSRPAVPHHVHPQERRP